MKKPRFVAAFAIAFVLLALGSNGYALRIANVPDRQSIEVANLELLHNRETGGGMLIATPIGVCDPCRPVTLSYDKSVPVSVRGFESDIVIDRSQVVRGSVSYDPGTMKVTSISLHQ